MEEEMVARYWCYMCSQMVNPIMDAEIKCPFCQSGFVEEMSSDNGGGMREIHDPDPDFGTDRALSLWAPILLGMMSSPRRRRRLRRVDFGDEHGGGGDDDDDIVNGVDDGGGGGGGNDVYHHHRHYHHLRRHGGEIDLDREFESLLRRRRRSSATILQLLQGIRAGIASEYESSENARDRERESVIMINPLNQSAIIQDSNQTRNQSPLASLGDYFVGPGLDLLLQHLAENDPNRHGTPPARKEAIEALPTVKISESLQCSVCLDDFEKGTEAKVMPCKHKFHRQCILPWLELHSSCPVCRYELPADETKIDSERPRIRTTEENGSNENGGNIEGDNEGRSRSGSGSGSGSGRRFSFPWPFSGLFSSSSSSPASSSSSPSSSSSSRFQPGENNSYSRSYGPRS